MYVEEVIVEVIVKMNVVKGFVVGLVKVVDVNVGVMDLV